MTQEQWQAVVDRAFEMATAFYYDHCGGQDETAARSAATAAFMDAVMAVQPGG